MNLKGKTIACFVALPHHSRFLWPIASAAERQGARLVYFTTMSDYPYERELVLKGKDVKLLQAYGNSLTSQKKTRMLKEFLEMWTDRLFSWSGNRHWPFNQVSKLHENAFEEFLCCERFIEKEKPDMILALHERNRWGKIIGYFSRKFGIPYLTMQEGEMYEDRLSWSGHTEYSSALMLWGGATMDILIRHGAAPEKMVQVGNTHLSGLQESMDMDQVSREVRKDLGIPNGKKIILFLVGLQWGVIKDREIWEMVLSDLPQREDIVVVLKWHPKITYDGYKKDFEPMLKEAFPTCVAMHNYDSYRLLAAAEYCVTLGKTTIAVEAIAFGCHLFSMPDRDGVKDHYGDWGVAQAMSPNGNWKKLYKTLDEGVPDEVLQREKDFMQAYFFKGNTETIHKSLEIMELLMNKPPPQPGRQPQQEMQTGRISYILPTGDDPDALFASLKSLSDNVKHDDWEVVVVIDRPEMKAVLESLSGDVVLIEHESDSLAALYNQGADAASGEILVFLKPGIATTNDTGLLEKARCVVVGVPIKTADMQPYCMGLSFDYNSVPRPIVDEGKEMQAVGGGWLATNRSLFNQLNGFDESLSNHFIEADYCLSASLKGVESELLEQGLAVVLLESCPEDVLEDEFWRKRIGFFAKWTGQSPKDDDYLEFASHLLNN